MDQNKKYILLAVSGETPQIITETLFKLRDTGYNIHEIHVITTVRGKNNLLELLSDDPEKNVFLKMCSEYGWDPLTVEERNIHVFSDMNGGFLEDIRTDYDERCAANFIFKTTKDLMDLRYGEDDSEYYPIVASIAGGRKTMSYLMGSTMSILGRSDDELTHVLVDPKFERLASPNKFYYPSRETKILKNANNDDIDAKDAKIELSFIPFIKLGQILKDSKKNPFKDGMQTAYSDAVDAINSKLTLKPEDLHLWISCKECEITDTKTKKSFTIHFEPIQMAFYRLLIDNLSVPDSVKKPSQETKIQAIFRYWLKLFSYTPFDRNWNGLDGFIHDINKVIDEIKSSKCLTQYKDAHGIPFAEPKTAFWDVYEAVIDNWRNYASLRNELNSNGMGQSCSNYSGKAPKKQNQLDYKNNETAFKKSHAENWKKLQDGVNNAIISSGCGDAIAEMLCIRHNSKNGTYSIRLSKEQIAMPGYEPLSFNKLDIPDDEISL